MIGRFQVPSATLVEPPCSRHFVVALAAEVVVGTGLTFVGIGDFAPLLWEQALLLFCYPMLCCLRVNDVLKVGMMKHCVPGGDRGPSGM